MSQNIHQIYIANPITSNTSTDLMYFGQSPYGAGNDAAMTYANFSLQFAANVLTTKGDLYTFSTVNARLAVGGTNGQILQVSSGASVGLAWSTAAYPATTTINQLLYSSSANTVAGLATANSSVLVTSAGGVPSLSTTLPSGLTIPGYANEPTNTNITSMTGLTGKLEAPTAIADTSGNNCVAFTYTASAVNYLTIVSAATTHAVALVTTGTDSNIALALGAKGSGITQIYEPTGSVSGTVQIYNAAQTHYTGLTVASGQSTNYTATLPAADGSNGSVLQSNGSGVWAFSTPTYPSASGSAGQIIRSNGTNNIYSTSTFADTYAASTLLYSNGANTVTGLATTNSASLSTNASGVPTWLALTDGQVVIGSSAGAPAAATLSAGTGVTITNGHNTITVASNGANPWVDETGSSVTMVANTGYTSDDGASLVTFTLPTTSAIGDWVEISGKGSGLWTIAQATGQQIHLGSSATTSGATGSLSSTNQYDSIRLRCLTANTIWGTISVVGNITVV